MVTIIGAGTFVTTNKHDGGFISVSFSLQPSVERLFQLGSANPYAVNVQRQESITLTNYGGTLSNPNSSGIALSPGVDCSDSTARMDITITPAPCLGSVTPIIRTDLTQNPMFITSYSYTKDFQGFGQESWSLQGKPILEGFTGNTAFIQGFAEGSRLVGSGIVSDDGIIMVASDVSNPDPWDAEGRNLQVTAGSPSIGQDDIQQFGRITRIGGAIGREDGLRGNSSVTIPHQLVFF